MSRMRMIVKCERCRKEEFITLTGKLDASMICLIRVNSDFCDISVFGTTMLLCSACQTALKDFKDFQELQEEAFAVNQSVGGMPCHEGN